ncbi:response regulator [Sulfitobacter noctilucicola]|uniref:Regulatory protein VirG n=1 Tax=Sulfitobacter noctilucicola TaxID=1342301 RepID=A0A7W6M6W2_9RHOB|nr:response regulator [Sulfitobacter noctilucicola]MBB4172787.1 DNA-binding response OmpR family regulator [Sulfitobacter noctilucicola]
MTDQTVLIVDDDPKVRSLLRNVLEDEGFAVEEAATASDALHIVESTGLTLITLDIHLGADNGIELARQIRQNSQVPIIMVTGKDDVIDRVVGLEVGADDYITKPFHVREVIARVRSVLRRSVGNTASGEASSASTPDDQPATEAHYRFDGMTAFPTRLELLDRDGVDCGLTSGDFKLLGVFLERPKRVLSRDQLMDLTGGLEWSPLDRTIDNQVARLRKKIERDPSNPKLIKTVRGVGYTFACDVKLVQGSDVSVKSA